MKGVDFHETFALIAKLVKYIIYLKSPQKGFDYSPTQC